MDNITQWVIGGWIMEKVVGAEPHQASWWQRNKALILGGLITNIPDLDIFIWDYIAHKNYMSEFLFHRGIMHSIFFNILVALLVGRICGKTDRYKRPWRRWALASYLSIMFWHIFVDAMTAYGGRYLLPFSSLTYSFDNIFVVDAFYTTLLIVLWRVYIFLRKKSARKIWYLIGAVWIIIYPIFSIVSKSVASDAFADSLQEQWVNYSRMITTPEPLQTFLWRGVVQVGQGYYEGYYSLFDKDKNIDWKYIPNNTLIRKVLIDKPDIQEVEKRWQWRTSYSSLWSGNMMINVVKMGGILWRQRQSTGDAWYSAFIVNNQWEVIGQWGRGRFLEWSFRDVWNAHRERVWGIE